MVKGETYVKTDGILEERREDIKEKIERER
jgi:hypothetical protein